MRRLARMSENATSPQVSNLSIAWSEHTRGHLKHRHFAAMREVRTCELRTLSRLLYPFSAVSMAWVGRHESSPSRTALQRGPVAVILRPVYPPALPSPAKTVRSRRLPHQRARRVQLRLTQLSAACVPDAANFAARYRTSSAKRPPLQ